MGKGGRGGGSEGEGEREVEREKEGGKDKENGEMCKCVGGGRGDHCFFIWVNASEVINFM